MPVPAGPVTGSTGSGATPCAWTVDTSFCSTWGDYSAAIRNAATDYASLILWAATGRRFGTCEVTVRPCGSGQGSGCGQICWDGSNFLPYFLDTATECAPSQQVHLPGPVNSVISVLVDGVEVDSDGYRVDSRLWLVRTDGGAWPACADLDATSGEGLFEIIYERGEAVPAALSVAAGQLACEFAKALSGGECRLPGRAKQVIRQGVSITMIDPSVLLEKGLTGLTEVDQVIAALNPNGLKSRPRVYSPDLETPRQVTS